MPFCRHPRVWAGVLPSLSGSWLIQLRSWPASVQAGCANRFQSTAARSHGTRSLATHTDPASFKNRADRKPSLLKLHGGPNFHGYSFGADLSVSGEVVFTTSLVGYPESMTDPSYRGQILCFTQPLIGNYGVPAHQRDRFGLQRYFESDHIQVAGIVVANYSSQYSHWAAVESLGEWCRREGVPAISGVDTRELTQYLRNQGSSLGQLHVPNAKGRLAEMEWTDPNAVNLVADVSTKVVQIFNHGARHKIALLDCGVKHNIIRQLALLDCEVHLVPHNYDLSVHPEYDGVFLSNGPGSPLHCHETIDVVRKLLYQDRPIFGICMGNLLLGAAIDVPIYKLQFGNRAHNQPALCAVDGQCIITSQNHGYALDDHELPREWEKFFTNANDGSNEGIRHRSKPFSSVQFHPEAKGGPEDSMNLFQRFIDQVQVYKSNRA